LTVRFGNGFYIEFRSYVGSGERSATIEYNLHSSAEHPLDDEVIGIARGHFAIHDPAPKQFDYLNTYVNWDNRTKLRIRLQGLR
jgi:hypothetical protein